MGTLKVVMLKSELKSFRWNDGLFAILKRDGDTLHLWKIKEGKLERLENGTPNITCTGVSNKGVIPTDMFITHEALWNGYIVSFDDKEVEAIIEKDYHTFWELTFSVDSLTEEQKGMLAKGLVLQFDREFDIVRFMTVNGEFV